MLHKMNLGLSVGFLHLFYALAYVFIPDDYEALTDARLPVLYNISATQKLPYSEAPFSSFAGYSFITASTGDQYLLITGIIASESLSGYGGSILDLQSLRYSSYSQSSSITNEELLAFNFSKPNYHWSSVTPDNLNLVIRSTQENVTFDLAINATSRALYYGGGGANAYLNDLTYNWALPACETSGTISLPRSSTSGALETISINSSASFTWYDRMWGAPALLDKNSTYFNLFFDNSELFLGTYAVSKVDPPLRSLSCNIRRRNESLHVFAPLDIFTPDAHEIWTSPRTGQVYPQKWKLGIESRGILEIQSVTEDQETMGLGGYGTTYLGFVTFTGVFDGQEVTGFGAVEMRYILPLPQV